MTRDVTNHLLFEVATEVANRVGGIYSVLKSKAPITVAEYKERYTLIGPLNHDSAAVEVEELQVQDPHIKATLDSMASRGIRYIYGRWLIEGAPRVLLFDVHSAQHHLDEWKTDLGPLPVSLLQALTLRLTMPFAGLPGCVVPG
uniref:Glycogen [starch] synthase n=1 Tax=uncultured Debaryomyces TaxID=687796 RepID=A0A060CEW8_9SACH|nr:Glycogen_syn [uncultured Debaryomyces]